MGLIVKNTTKINNTQIIQVNIIMKEFMNMINLIMRDKLKWQKTINNIVIKIVNMKNKVIIIIQKIIPVQILMD